MSQTYILVIKGALANAEKALRVHGFSSWHVVQGSVSETIVNVAEDALEDSYSISVEDVLNYWFSEDTGAGNLKPGSLLFWKVYEPQHGDAGVSSKRTKILRDLDGLSPFKGGDYYTVVIPTSLRPTIWHGPQTLTRGVFATEEQAHVWARENLDGQPYTVQLIKGYAQKRTKILRDLDGVDTRAGTPLWATVRPRRT